MRDGAEIRSGIAVLRGGVAAVHIAVLELLDDAIRLVVHHHDRDIQSEMLDGLQFLDVNLKPAVAVLTDDLPLWHGQLRPDRRTECVPHRGIAAGGEECVPLDDKALM